MFDDEDVAFTFVFNKINKAVNVTRFKRTLTQILNVYVSFCLFFYNY